MATVIIKQPREQDSHFGLYRTSAGGDESIIVRRKVGEPTDVVHSKSRRLARQREYLTLASRHYAHLTPSQKAITRHQFEIVEYETGHSRTETKLLSGRQLFVSKEMHSLKTTGKQLVLPYEVCIMLVDEAHYPLEGKLWLRYPKDDRWYVVDKEELVTGNWLFSAIPRDKEAYRVYGEVEGYQDPNAPDGKEITEAQLLTYHYHVLHTTLERYCYVEPPVATAGSQHGGWRRAQFFKPTTSFNLNQIQVTLRRHYPPDNSWMLSAFLAIHSLGPERIPIEPPLHTENFDLVMPPFPEWQTHAVTFPGLPLTEGQEYALVFGTPPPHDPDIAVAYQCGGTGTCWIYGYPTHAWSAWSVDHWSDWQTYNTAWMCYEMRQLPT